MLGEFYVTVTRKLACPISGADAAREVDQLARLPVVPIDAALVRDAVAAAERWGISYWDALIISAARAAGCRELLSEDLQHGRDYDDVRVIDPFKDRANAPGVGPVTPP